MTATDTPVTLEPSGLADSPRLSRAVTRLPSRDQLVDHVERELIRARKGLGFRFVVLSVELDAWRATVASHGKQVGDELVDSAGGRIVEMLSAQELVTPLGSGTLAVMIDGTGPHGTALDVADRIQRGFMMGFGTGDNMVYTTASIGIAKVASPYTNAEDIIGDAATAMRRSRALGKARATVFRLRMYEDPPDTGLEAELRSALENREFELQFQPIVSGRSGQVEAFEALLRWRHPSLGLRAPLDFLPTLKSSGLMKEVGEWVIGEASTQALRWSEKSGRTIPVTVNLAAEEFSDPMVLGAVNGAIDRFPDPGALTIEISEDALLEGIASSGPALTGLRERGVRIVLDDFGAGYSSLDYLRKLPIDGIKIDASFADRIEGYAEDRPVVQGIVELARKLDLAVFAEGIEEPAQLGRLLDLDCEGVQGFLISSPVDSELAARMAETNWHPALDAMPTSSGTA
ncbi:MAG: GGDEF domain-containing phosphodiesterase [Gemmatimonadales bacterium]